MREKLWVLGAFNVEISRAVETTDIATGAIRLKWWMEALEAPRKHPIVEALHHYKFDSTPLLNAIEAREADIEKGYQFVDMKALDTYATDTGAFWCALAEDAETRQWLASLGQVWVLQGLLWASGYQLSQGYSAIPRAVVASHGIDPVNDAKEEDVEAILHIIQSLARRVEETLKRLKTPANAPLKRALPLLYWRAHKMQQTPELALALTPAESRIKLLWKLFIGK